MVGITQQTVLVPIQYARDIDELIAMPRELCETGQQAILLG
ncbi:MAG: hypothetical protein AAGB11_08980 [Pseudomonadota bacterium]